MNDGRSAATALAGPGGRRRSRNAQRPDRHYSQRLGGLAHRQVVGQYHWNPKTPTQAESLAFASLQARESMLGDEALHITGG